jgi:hypothetical protein
VVALTVLWAALVFLFSVAEFILGYVSGIFALLGIVMLIAGQTSGGITFMVGAFLLSPVGIPAVADWLIDRAADINDALKGFITT